MQTFPEKWEIRSEISSSGKEISTDWSLHFTSLHSPLAPLPPDLSHGLVVLSRYLNSGHLFLTTKTSYTPDARVHVAYMLKSNITLSLLIFVFYLFLE